MAGSSLNRKPAQAKSREYSLVSEFKNGYRNREDETTLPPGVLIEGSQNVLTDTNNRTSMRKGYVLDGQASTDAAPIASAFDWVTAGGFENHLRSGFLTSAANDGKLQQRFVHDDGTIEWIDLITALDNVEFNYTQWWDNSRLLSCVLAVNGNGFLYQIYGAEPTTVLSGANPTGIVGTINPPNSNIATTPDSGGVGYVVGDVLTLTGGSGTAVVTVRTVVDGAVNAVGIHDAGNSYSVNDTVIINGVGAPTAAKLLITTVDGGGGVTGFSIVSNGQLYSTGTAIGTATQGGGTGFTVDITSIGLGVETVGFTSDANHGTGYSVAVVNATGGTGTNAKLGILTITSGTITKSGTQTWSEAGFLTGMNVLNEAALSVNIGGVTYSYDHFQDVYGDTTTLYGVTPDPSGIVAGTPIIQTVTEYAFTTITVDNTTFNSSFTPNLIAAIDQRVFLGVAPGNNTILSRGLIFISKVNDFLTYGQATSGAVGDPFEIQTTSPVTAFVPQEQYMYVSAGHDEWYNISFTLSADLQSESVSINRLNTSAQQAAQSQAAISKSSNSIVFLSFEPIIQSFGRVPNILANNAPQMTDLSSPIVNDMNVYDFTNAAIAYHRKFMYVAVPVEGLVLVYNMTDPANPYWEAPQVLPISRFSIIDGELYGHSSQVSETYQLFTGTADRVTPTSAGQPIAGVWRFSYENYGSRFSFKKATKMYVEGYINANTTLTTTLTYELDGCKTVKTFELDGADQQFVCIGTDESSLGKVSLGKVKLGGDKADSLQNLPPKFRWFPTFSNTDFFECSVSFSVIGLNQQMELLAFGLAASVSSEIPVQNMD